eukprot:COSAG01_NODE_13817_length_1531_cov_1.208799_1_plen_142_part_01
MLQSVVRTHLACVPHRHAVVARRRAATALQSLLRMQAAWWPYQCQRGASVAIQRRLRGHVAAQRYRCQLAGFRALQTLHRGCVARREHRRRQRAKAAREAKAVTVLQSLLRTCAGKRTWRAQKRAVRLPSCNSSSPSVATEV